MYLTSPLKPSIDEISHSPVEKSDWEYIENAANIIFGTLKSFNK